MKQIILFVFVSLALTTALAADTRQSGYQSMRAETRTLQDDDSQNPAMLWVEEGAGHG